MADIHKVINDICYIISTVALVGILIFIILDVILENIDTSQIPTWGLQIMGSTIAAIITVVGALGAIHYRDYRDDRINIKVDIKEHSEEDIYGGISGYLVVSMRNRSSKRAITVDSFELKIYEDGKEHVIEYDWKKEERNKNIAFPYDLLPGKKLSITLEGSDDFREYFLDETGEYNFPVMGCLIACFEDQSENLYQRSLRIC